MIAKARESRSEISIIVKLKRDPLRGIPSRQNDRREHNDDLSNEYALWRHSL